MRESGSRTSTQKSRALDGGVARVCEVVGKAAAIREEHAPVRQRQHDLPNLCAGHREEAIVLGTCGGGGERWSASEISGTSADDSTDPERAGRRETGEA